MRVTATFAAMALGLAVMVAGCGSPPTADVEAARASVDNAATVHADQYAADSLKAAQDARAALDAELKAQEGKWVKSYDRSRELAATAKAADAVAGKERADATAARARADRAAAREKAKKEAVRVGGRVKPPVKVKDVAPVYPAIAKSARVQGTVVVEATVGADGKVVDARVVKSVPMLDQAALDAVQQWEYTPSLRNGVPVPVVMTITVNFKLQ